MKLLTPRQKKIAGLVQKELALLINNKIKLLGNKGLIVSITKVVVSIDISLAKIYLSVFKYDLSQKIKNQLRKTPELTFFIDDSLDYIDNINSVLKNPENPIKIGNGDSK